MKEIEQIKMRKDIFILKNKYQITDQSIAKEIGVVPKTVWNFLNGKTKILIDKNHKKFKQGLLNIQQELKEAEEYQGFDN